jgi:hypothetical protein
MLKERQHLVEVAAAHQVDQIGVRVVDRYLKQVVDMPLLNQRDEANQNWNQTNKNEKQRNQKIRTLKTRGTAMGKFKL